MVSYELNSLRSAAPAVDGKVVKSMTRKRSRVTGRPELFVKVRRKLNVPCAPLVTGVGSRTSLGAEVAADAGSSSEAAMRVPPAVSPGSDPLTGLDKFSGPGAPSFEALPLNVPPVVDTKIKSA